MTTAADIATFTEHDDYEGFGYIGHAKRTDDTDQALAEAATHLGLTDSDLFAWANSRPARHFMDGAPSAATGHAFRDAAERDITRHLPAILAEG